jgi:YegS/Rv2252/BmrU family lipid kinase
MEEKRLLLLFNKMAGKGKIAKHLAEIIDTFTKNGYLVTAVTTQHPDHMQELITERASGYDMLVVSGGDGSLQEAVSGLVQLPKDQRPLFGYIPAGSTNDFARSIGIPSDMVKAAEVISKGQAVSCDLGSFGPEYFTYVAAFGAFTEVTYATPQEFKNLIGHQAYFIEGVKSIPNIRPIRMRVELEDEVIEGEFIYGMISNSKSVGGVKNWAGKDVVLDDGIYELTLVRSVENPLLLNEIIPQLFTGRSSEYVIRKKCASARILTEEPLEWVLDGEFGGAYEDVEFRAMQKEIEICI